MILFFSMYIISSTTVTTETYNGNGNALKGIELNKKGNRMLQSGNFNEALRYYFEASIMLPYSHAIHSNIISMLIKLGKPLTAVEHAMKIGLINNKTGKVDRKHKLNTFHHTNKTKGVSIYGVLGVAFHNLDQLDLAVDSFLQALLENDKDGITWLNLGDCLLHMRKANYSIWAYENALLVHNVSNDYSPLLRARSWLCDWRDRENLEILVLNSFKDITNNIRNANTIRATGDFIDVKARCKLNFETFFINKSSCYTRCC
jgi:tetratricopeptide (TPR) repeat protein